MAAPLPPAEATRLIYDLGEVSVRAAILWAILRATKTKIRLPVLLSIATADFVVTRIIRQTAKKPFFLGENVTPVSFSGATLESGRKGI